MGRVEGKIIIVTGASSGIGAKTAKVLAAEGAKVVIAARRVEMLQAVADEITSKGGEVLVVPTDIRVIEQAENLVARTVEKYGRLDVLVNNAGILDVTMRPIEEFLDEDLDAVLDTNTKGTMYVTRAATQVFDKQGVGNIVTVSSIGGSLGGSSAAYCASKGALISLTKNIALRYAYKDPVIRANAICPGSVWTPICRATMAAQEHNTKGATEQNDSFNKHGTIDVGISKTIDIANIILFLSSDESRSINGQIINVDIGANL